MNAENFVVNDGCESEAVEYIRTVAPYIQRTVFSQTLVVKAIDLRNLSGLVIASD